MKRMLDVAGLKDIDVSVRGNKGRHLYKINCLLRALQEIESPQEKANRTGYNIVRIDPQQGDKPEIVARPTLDRYGITENRKPHPQTKKYMTQKLDINHFNVSASILFGDHILTRNFLTRNFFNTNNFQKIKISRIFVLKKFRVKKSKFLC